jgi:hypothetical protein
MSGASGIGFYAVLPGKGAVGVQVKIQGTAVIEHRANNNGHVQRHEM